MGKHIVKSYDQELGELRQEILDMGHAAESQLDVVLNAMIQNNQEQLDFVLHEDIRVNRLKKDVNELTVHMLAARQPLAVDLRVIISALKIATDLERIGDYTKNIARQIHSLNGCSAEKNSRAAIIEMAEIAKVMLSKVLEAYTDSEVEKALEVHRHDREIDERYAVLLGNLQQCMMKNAENVSSCTALLFIARCLERIGDHIKNVAEDIYFIKTGEQYGEASA